jgi:high-affinity K+ transport system ATPase subunit B
VEVAADVVERMTAIQRQGKIAVVCAINGQLAAIVAITDAIKPEAPAVVKALHLRGIKVYMVTGDNVNSAVAIGASIGIDPANIIAQVTPGEKADVVRRVRADLGGSPVSFVGDGGNDAVGLAEADVGIAIGNGTDIAVETASVVLMRNDLTDVVTCIDLSRAVMRRILWNFHWACLYNFLAIPLAAGVFYPLMHMTMPPIVAAMAMGASSVSVIVSSLMLKGWKKTEVIDEVDPSKRKGVTGKGMEVMRRVMERVTGKPTGRYAKLAVSEEEHDELGTGHTDRLRADSEKSDQALIEGGATGEVEVEVEGDVDGETETQAVREKDAGGGEGVFVIED